MDLYLELNEAKNQWQNLQSIYNEVTDPAVIDSVVHQMIVVEQRYDQLLRKAREQALVCNTIQLR